MTAPMTEQLQWRKPNDWLLIGSSRTGRDVYEIRRELDYRQHPAVRWKYLPKRIADGYEIPGDFHTDSTLARAACENDLKQPQPSAASGDDHGR